MEDVAMHFTHWTRLSWCALLLFIQRPILFRIWQPLHHCPLRNMGPGKEEGFMLSNPTIGLGLGMTLEKLGLSRLGD